MRWSGLLQSKKLQQGEHTYLPFHVSVWKGCSRGHGGKKGFAEEAGGRSKHLRWRLYAFNIMHLWRGLSDWSHQVTAWSHRNACRKSLHAESQGIWHFGTRPFCVLLGRSRMSPRPRTKASPTKVCSWLVNDKFRINSGTKPWKNNLGKSAVLAKKKRLGFKWDTNSFLLAKSWPSNKNLQHPPHLALLFSLP